MLAPILIALAVIVVLFVIVVAMRPSEFRVSRSLAMAAPAETAFEQVNTLRNWEAWNPWGKVDPNCKLTYEGPPSGTGASYSWAGSAKVGKDEAPSWKANIASWCASGWSFSNR